MVSTVNGTPGDELVTVTVCVAGAPPASVGGKFGSVVVKFSEPRMTTVLVVWPLREPVESRAAMVMVVDPACFGSQVPAQKPSWRLTRAMGGSPFENVA